MVLHDPLKLDRCLNVWPNAKVIVLTNSEEFIKFRNKSEYIARNTFNHHQCRFYWDCRWFLDYTLVNAKLQNLYDVLVLSDYNPLAISRYYTAWITSLEKLASIDK